MFLVEANFEFMKIFMHEYIYDYFKGYIIAKNAQWEVGRLTSNPNPELQIPLLEHAHTYAGGIFEFNFEATRHWQVDQEQANSIF